MTALLERDAPLAALEERLQIVRSEGRGTLVLVGGEAGVGKSTLVRTLCLGAGAGRVLWGACDPLDTPRPLGPLADIAEDVGGELAARVEEGTASGEIVAALGRELKRERPTILVLEDLHWADEATLDVVRILARRADQLPALMVGTYRDDELDRAHPLRIALGEVAGVERIVLAPLSPDAVCRLAAPAGLDANELHRLTGGNPFFVTEAVAGGDLSATARDAVLGRAARLSDAGRAMLDAVSVVPQRAEIALLEVMTEPGLPGLDECLASGMLAAEAAAVRFRHEIARLAIAETLPPHRRIVLHRRALAALSAAPAPDLARAAHHAAGAGDAAAVLRYAPAAAERAARLRAHREAAAHLGRALDYADRLPAEERAALFERRSFECYLTDDMPAAVEARRRALEVRRASGDRRGEGDAHRWLSRLAWFSSDNTLAAGHAAQAIALLGPLGPSRELAMAYSNMSQLRMLMRDRWGTDHWGEQAIAMAEALGETETLVHALNNVGTVRLELGLDVGYEPLERSLALAQQAGLEEHVARAYTNLGSGHLHLRRYPLAERYLAEGIAYSRDRDLDAWALYMSAHAALSALDQGRWDEAAELAASVAGRPGVAATSRIVALSVLGQLRARRGDPEVWPPLDDALALARQTGELQRLARVAAARAEADWLAGADERLADDTEETLALAVELEDAWSVGELAVWRRRAGLDEPAPPIAAEPFALELAGERAAAAACWRELGCPYEAALAAGDRDGLEALQRLGAKPAAQRLARELRAAGVRDLPAGPRAATRENPAELTARELEVLALLAQDLRNADIAERLFLSQRTVAHHVSAILRKLDAPTRAQAVTHAARLGIVDR